LSDDHARKRSRPSARSPDSAARLEFHPLAREQPPPRCAGSKQSPDPQIRRRGFHRRREHVQTEDSSALAPPLGTKSTAAQHQGGHGREGVTIDLPQVDCSTCPTTRA
jgi:hypothetical protein